MKKKMLAVILVAVAILLLAGCEEKPVSEETLKVDLYNSSSFSRFSEQLGMKITDLEVIKRQTYADEKIDTVWVKIKAAGDTAEGEMYYIMTYWLYNDGWQIESITDDEANQWTLIPTIGVDEETILAYVKSETNLDDFEYLSVESLFSDKIEYHYVQRVEYHNYMTEIRTYKVSCSFSLSSYEWEITDMECVSLKTAWDAIGSWYDSGETSYYYTVFRSTQTEYTISANVYRSDETTLSIDYDVSGIQGKHETGTVYFDLTSPFIDGRSGNLVYRNTMLGNSSFLTSTWLWGSAGGEVYFIFHEDLGLYLCVTNSDNYFLTREI